MKNKEAKTNEKFLFVYCNHCRKYQPARTDTFVFKRNKKNKKKFPNVKKDFKVVSVACGICDFVQNMNRTPKMKRILYKELKKKGWEIRTQKSTSKAKPNHKK